MPSRPARPIRKVLVANRGEIAVRILRALREMGIGSVAVFSDADRAALHVRLADEARRIGGPAPGESYLRFDRIFEAARETGADAIHPGYGFLAENEEFASACAREGFVFIGPPPEAMRVMGEKTAAREKMRAAGVPIVPGSRGAVRDLAAAIATTREIGFPILLKAAYGGGGKGMRVVRTAGELESAFSTAASEAAGAFGRGELFIERWIERPRHIEIQVFADAHGNVIHLNERECSIQRRHQKLIEESPSPVVSDALRREMGEVAVRAAAAVGYEGAGTVEFLLDAAGSFYFLEMNTRLQVEHPVTELVTGLDLVREQVRVAAGEKLSLRQEDVRRDGWAIECRVTAEDPERGFMPSSGTVRALRFPEGPGVRNDAGIYDGYPVPLFYDSLLAKLIVWAPDRERAIERLTRALDEYVIEGVKTSLPFHRFVVRDPAFRAGDLSTAFVEERYRPPRPAAASAPGAGDLPPIGPEEQAALVAAAALFFRGLQPETAGTGAVPVSGGRAAAAAADHSAAWRQGARSAALRRGLG